MAGAKDIVTLAGPTGIVVMAFVVVFGLILTIPSSDPPTGGYSSGDCVSGQPGADDGQGPMKGVHPVASTALRRAGITEGMISQGLGNAGASSGTHGPISGSSYGGAADIRTASMSDDTIKLTVHNLRMQGFAAWYREPGWQGAGHPGNAHIHAGYAGLPTANEISAGQIQTFIDSESRRRNGLAGDLGNSFPLDTFPTPEEIASVKSVYQGGSGCVGGSGGGPVGADAKTFIAWIGPLAAADDTKTQVPASVTIAQSILESGWGKSKMATGGKNLFGIKGDGPAGFVLNGKGEHFRAFFSYEDGIAYHSQILSNPSGYYKNWWSLRNDPEAYIRGIAETYAPVSDGNVNYAGQIIGMIRRYNLTQYDR